MADLTTYRCTYFLQHSYYGYSQTWWTAAADFKACCDKVKLFADALMATHPPEVMLNFVRVSLDLFPRRSRLLWGGNNNVATNSKTGTVDLVIKLPGKGTAPDTEEFRPDQGKACALIEVRNNGLHVAFRYFAPAPDALIVQAPGGVDVAKVPTWLPLFVKWKKIAIADWFIKAQTPQGGPGDPPVATWDVQNAPPNFLTATFKPGVSLPVTQGDKVLVRGVKMARRGMRSPNGTWRVHSVVASGAPNNTQTLTLRSLTGISPGDIKELGNIRARVLAPQGFDSIDLDSGGTHKRGAPFGAGHGRRSTRG